MNNIIAYTILLIIVMYVLKSNIEKFAIDIGNTPPPLNPPDISGVSIGNTTATPSSGGGIFGIGNTTATPSSGGGIFGIGNTAPSASSDDLEAKVAAFCKSAVK